MNNEAHLIRKPAVAGMFYPSNPAELAKTIAGLFADVEKTPISGRPAAIIAPHAGYPYSGKTAAKAYKLLEGEEYDTVVIVSPSHTVFFKGSSVFSGDAYQTPLGNVEIDKELATRIASVNPTSVYFSNMGHASGGARGEHALEVQLPFLQIVLGKFKLVAIVMGDQESDSIRALGETLAGILKDTNTLLIASTDLSHFHSEKAANRLDSAVRKAIEQYDPAELMETLDSGKGEACGGGPVCAVMTAAKRMGAKEVTFLEYTTSGATTGDFEEVVGYLSAVITQQRARVPKPTIGSRPATKQELETLTDDDKLILKKIVRDAIAAKLDGAKYTPPSSERLEQKRGLFVTLTLDGELRGCIGTIRARAPISEATADMAQAAAFEDPRFPELTRDEFERLEYEISVLSSLERVRDFSDIVVGRDGLMIKLNMHTGLLLPQVATENDWDYVQFLEQTCLKAGISRNSYKDKHAEIYRFTAEIF